LISPSGTITDTTPTYVWNAVPSATYYQLYVNDMTGNRIQQWYTADACGCASGTGTCSITPTTEVVGSCIWYIQSYNGAGYSPWSSGLSFTTPIPTPPSEATLISPSGVILEATPTYRWNPVSNSTWYCLYVNDSTGNKINQWYAAADAGCPDGVGTCSATPTIALAAGAGEWYIRTYNSSGYGPWSAPMAFTVTTPTLISPSGTIATLTPTYTWNALSTATDYYLWVNDSTGNRIQQWYTAADAGCASGAGTCSVTPATVLTAGDCQWWLKAKNTSGEGPWSSGMPFTIPAPGAATLISPSGTITDTTPTYTWNAVPISTHYYLWVNDSTGNRIQQWYTAADCGCSSGTGTCSVTPSTVLNPGACSWWIQTYNNAGYGRWSSGMSFTVSP
jgi:hypothetical protein